MAAGLTGIVSEFLQRLNVASPHVVGHSLGGLVASLLAASGRTSSVINVDQPFFMGDWIPTARRLEHRLRGSDYTEAQVEWMDELGGPELPRSVREELCRYRASTRQQQIALSAFSLFFTPTETEQSIAARFESILRGVRCPYLALLGSDPGSEYARWLTRLVPSARVEIWDGMGHWLHRVDPERFATRVLGFLANVTATTGAA